MELGDLLRNAVPGDPAMIRETAAALETLLAQAVQVRSALDSAGSGVDDDDVERATEMRVRLDAEIAEARRQRQIVLAFADRQDARRAEVDRAGERLDPDRDRPGLLPMRLPDDGGAVPWWAWPRVSTMLQMGRAPDGWSELVGQPRMAVVDAVYLALTAWRQTHEARLDELLSPPVAADVFASPARPSSAAPEDLVRLARLRSTPAAPTPSGDGTPVGRGGDAEASAASPGSDVAAVLARTERMMTLLVATPDALVMRQAWMSRGAAVLAIGDGTTDVTTMLEPDAVPARWAVLAGIGEAGEDTGVDADPFGWDVTTDRETVEALLSPDAAARARSIEVLRSDTARHSAADGPWRAWCATVIRPSHDIVDGSSIIVVDTSAGLLLACPLADWATLRPASAATVRAALQGLATW